MQRPIAWMTVTAMIVGLVMSPGVFAQAKPGTGIEVGKPGTALDAGKAVADPSKAGGIVDKAKMGTGSPAAMVDPKKSGMVDLNTADEATLSTLKGIGPVKAKAITQYRSAHGGFKSIDELKNVPGIGDKTFDGLKTLITVSKSPK